MRCIYISTIDVWVEGAGLTLGAGGALPAVLTDAGEGVAGPHTRPPVSTGSRVTRVVLSCTRAHTRTHTHTHTHRHTEEDTRS